MPQKKWRDGSGLVWARYRARTLLGTLANSDETFEDGKQQESAANVLN